MKFGKRGDRTIVQQTFDKDKIFVEKAGKKINCYDAIQAANVDTDIYEVMKKYHCQEDTALQLMQERGGEKGIYQDIREIQENCEDIGDIIALQQQAQQMFEELPVEVKTKYGNDLTEFMKAQEKAEKDALRNQTTEPKQDETK